MDDSILRSTKKMLGIEDGVTAFDLEITTHINSTFSHLHQIGIGNAAAIDSTNVATWSALGLPVAFLNMVKTFIFLKVKHSFDPPGTSYLNEAEENQIREQEWRLLSYAEGNFDG